MAADHTEHVSHPLMSSFKVLSKHSIPQILSLSDDEDDTPCEKTSVPFFMIDKEPAGASSTESESKKNQNNSLLSDSRLHAGLTVVKPPSRRSSASKELESKAVTADPQFLNKTSIGPVCGERLARKQRREEAKKTAGRKWFDMPATEMDEKIANDVQMINMRDALSASRFYKRNSGITSMKYFQVGTIIGSPADFYNDLPRRMRKRTLVEELTADADARSWHKRKYNEVLAGNPYYLKQKRREEAKQAKEKRDAKQAAAGQEAGDSRSRHYKGQRQQAKQNVFQKSRK